MVRRLTEAARAFRPDVFVPIDFPDFNFRAMAAIHGLGVPVVYYISPQLWAWRPGRMKTMRRYVDRVLVIFPFEEAIYQRAGVPVEFVGHPLIGMTRSAVDERARPGWRRAHGLAPDAPTVALLPGSRRSELAHIVPTIVEALPRIVARVPGAQFVVAQAPNLPDRLFEPLAAHPAKPVFVRERTDDVLAGSDVAITASGTATVQCAIHERPMVVVYRLSSLTYALGRPFALVDTYAMPNLIAGRRIVPELIQDGFTPERVAEETAALLTEPARFAAMRDALRDVRARLGGPGATARAAAAVLEVARAARARRQP
jgi:lipid-A-disaccharide synthase